MESTIRYKEELKMTASRKQKPKASNLKSHLGFWMRLVSNNVSQSFARKLEKMDVTVAEWVVLREMYSGDDTTSPGVVSELTGLTRGAVSKLISRLLEKKLVTRTEAVEDRRFQDIQLTDAAITMVPKLAKLADANDEEFFGVLSAEEREALAAALTKIVTHKQLKKYPID
jgi:DNA-binding MarR family transcriptional regulator